MSLRPKFKKTRHIVSIRCNETLELDSYPGAFSQILTNLILISLLHAYQDDEQGHLDIEITQKHSRLFLKYHDDGRGISRDILDRIFDPFFTTKRGQGGSGLGLHLVYNLVTQRLKGNIQCKSEMGKGTTFEISLPIHVGGEDENQKTK